MNELIPDLQNQANEIALEAFRSMNHKHESELWRAYAEGRADEREEWAALVAKLKADLAELRGAL